MDRKQKKQGNSTDSTKKGTDRSGALICLILQTALIVVLILNIFFNPEANTSAPAIIVFVLYCMYIAGLWVWYIRRVRQNRLNKNENKHSGNNVNNTDVAPATSVTTNFDADHGIFHKDSSSVEITQGSKTDGNTVFNNETTKENNSNIELHCKECNKSLIYVRGAARQNGMLHLQSGTYCNSCLPKLFQQGVSEILFIVDAEWGQYSKRVELREGKYYYVESRVTENLNPVANLWREDERKHEIGYDEALSYAKAITNSSAAEDVENLKIIESVKRKIRNQSNTERTWEKIAEFGLKQEILDHIVVAGDRIETDLAVPGGGPYMRGSGDSWSGAYSYDDMRGPQGRFKNVPFEEAFGNIATIVDSEINNPGSEYYFYNPDKVPWKRSIVAEKDIERCAYSNLQDIVSITVKDGVSHISDYAFQYCKNLESADIPNSVTDIGRFAFDGCSKLKRVRYHGTEEQWKKIEIGPGNDPLINAEITYGSECPIYETDQPDAFHIYLPLYTWSELIDNYSSKGVNYSYLRPKHQLLSQPFLDVAAGCGHGASGKNTITTWDKLLADSKVHSGEWKEETWKIVCEDFETHPELSCKAFDELKTFRKMHGN